MLFLRHIGFPPIHQFFLDVKVTRLTATDPEGGTGLMGVKGMEELGAGRADDVLNGEKVVYDLSVEHYWMDSHSPHRAFVVTRAEPRHRGTLTLSRGWVKYALRPRKRATQLFSMSLILSIFALVFITELISWIGKSFFLQFVHMLAVHGWLP
jgi:hypothetical protein